MHLKTLFLTREKRLDIIESVHELFKLCLHNLSPAVIFKNCIGTFFKSVSFGLREVLFLVFRKDRNEKNGNRVIALDIRYPAEETFDRAGPRVDSGLSRRP